MPEAPDGAVDVVIEARRGDLDLSVSLRLEPGTVVAVMGPNGSGKTTLLRALAGLDGERPAVLAGRAVGIVFQDLRLFPHLSACDNVAFAHEARGRKRRAARAHALDDLARVGASDLAACLPGALSGGETQRVAVARGLVGDPDLFLLDEPFASLDATARHDLRRDLAKLMRAEGRCTVLVTHDPVDALVLADSVIVIEHGRVTHEGSIADIARHPRTPWAADLLGVNLIGGVGTAEGLVTDRGTVVVAREPVVVGVPALARFEPATVALHTVRPEATSARNIWPGEVVGAEQLGSRVRVEITGDVDLVAELTAGSVERLGLVVGTEVWAEVKASEVTAYPAPVS